MSRSVKLAILPITVLISLLAAWSPDAGSYSAGEKTHGVLLELVPTQDMFRRGEPKWKSGDVVRVLVVITNDSKRTLHFALTDPYSDWLVDLRDETGNPVPENEEFIERREKLNGRPVILERNILVTLKPHEQTQDGVELSYRYKLRVPGKYSVQVRGGFPEVSKQPVLSNRLEFTIIP